PGMANCNDNPVWKQVYVVVYLEKILVYSKTLMIMFGTFKKCLNVFEKTVFVLNSQNPAKCQKVLDWPQPMSVKPLQGFLGFANFYRKFLKNYSKTIFNLTSLLQKDNPFLFTEQASKEFEALKKAFTTAPILAHFSELAQTLIKTDA
ncbi:putative retrotransposon nucleocapsid protein, partial [Puccinia sorghi]